MRNLLKNIDKLNIHNSARQGSVYLETGYFVTNGISHEHLILYNNQGEIDVFADFTDDIILDVVMVNHGYWIRHINGKTVNALISNKPSKIGKGITVNDTVVFIKKPSQSQKFK